MSLWSVPCSRNYWKERFSQEEACPAAYSQARHLADDFYVKRKLRGQQTQQYTGREADRDPSEQILFFKQPLTQCSGLVL